VKEGQSRTDVVRRLDYQVPAFLVDAVRLDFDIDAERTEVRGELELRRNPAHSDAEAPLYLDGEKLELLAIQLDDRELDGNEYRQTETGLTIPGVGDTARLVTRVAINPAANTELEGLYQSGDFLLTQCEAEGFRKITYYPDRPDVMAPFRVTLRADRERFPVLLSNGNRVDAGGLDDGRHYITWADPFPKPSYLFAVVAGDLACVEDRFTTRSGKDVALKFFVEHGSEHLCGHALESLNNAMRWDEQRFGLEYDLDIYHVVVTHDFNMGAMENKSLNIFNSKYVLASQETATDLDFQNIEGVIGHEYFHNWTGNRVTCRDWFQLTLKEGLTVFRDQEFSRDMQSAAVKRIEDVRALRSRQFAEDAGPMAHPVRPDAYQEINNFYTPTVYEKGAQVVRMYQTLLGRDGFRRGIDLYFQRHDGQAVTCDDFLAATADANGRGLELFCRWYGQSGTPVVHVGMQHDPAAQTCTLHVKQHTPPTADQQDKQPLHIPLALGLLDADGNDIPLRLQGEPEAAGATTRVLELTAAEQAFTFEGIAERPLPSLLRDFSAPVKLEYDYDRADLARLMANDSDLFCRWDAAERLAVDVLLEMAAQHQSGDPVQADPAYLEACARIVGDTDLDPALAAEALTLPGEDYLAEQVSPVPVDSIHAARRIVREQLVETHGEALMQRCRELSDAQQPWAPDAGAVGRRRLKNVLLDWLAAGGDGGAAAICRRQYRDADNMTDRQSALRLLLHNGIEGATDSLADFESRFSQQPLVMDKWFALQATIPGPGTLDRVRKLMDHPAFSLSNPNKARALIGAFAAGNPTGFHAADGSGYRFVAEQVLALDALNPQVAARLAAVFNRWTRYDEQRRSLMRRELERMTAREGLSPNTSEIVRRALADA